MLHTVWQETYRVLEWGGRLVVVVANVGRKPYVPLASLIVEQLQSLGYLMRGEVIWDKGPVARSSCAWGSWRSASNPTIRDGHEYCLLFSKGQYGRCRKGVSTISAEEFQDATCSVWRIPPESAKRVGHPAPFPVDLVARFIKLYTYEDDLVLDPFIGSGTTAVAAKQLGRRWAGYDIVPEYISRAYERLASVH